MTPTMGPTYTVSFQGTTYTREEVEYEAAMRVASSFNLPGAKLVELAKKFPPPQEWFDADEERPF